jgi:hypothetical protein
MTPIIIRAVKHRPDRVENVQRMLEAVPDARVVWDQTRNSMDTWMSALYEAGDEAILQLEDDIRLAPGFRDKAEKAISERPDSIIQFFSMRKADLDVGSRWDRSFVMGQCTYYPAGYCKQIAEFSVEFRRITHGTLEYATDYMVRDWLKRRKEPYWIHVPNLVDHLPIQSAVDPRRSKGRSSKTFHLNF